MGVSEDDFWRLTPAQFFRLVEQSNEKIKRSDARAGILISLVHNMFAKRSRKPDYWFPSLKPKKKAARVASEKELKLKALIANAYLKRGLKANAKKKSRNS